MSVPLFDAAVPHKKAKHVAATEADAGRSNSFSSLKTGILKATRLLVSFL